MPTDTDGPIIGIQTLTCGCVVGLQSTNSNTSAGRNVTLRRCPSHEDLALAEEGMDEYVELLEKAEKSD